MFVSIYVLTYYTLLTVYYYIHWCSSIWYNHAPDANKAKKQWKELVVCGDARTNCEIRSSVMSLLTYNCQTWEDRRVSPWGNLPGAWGTQHGWSTWGCSQTLMLTAAFADMNHRVCFEILPVHFKVAMPSFRAKLDGGQTLVATDGNEQSADWQPRGVHQDWFHGFEQPSCTIWSRWK